jgi:hypothetical protein
MQKLQQLMAMQMLAATVLTENHPELLAIRPYREAKGAQSLTYTQSEHDKARLAAAEAKRARKAAKRVKEANHA